LDPNNRAVQATHAAAISKLYSDRLKLRKVGEGVGSGSMNRVALNAAIAEKLRRRPSREWIELLTKADVPCGPVYAIDESFNDPHVRQLGIVRSVCHPSLGDIDLLAQPVVLERTPSRMERAAPERGEHTADVLGMLGYNAAAIAELRRKAVI
jgi:crotonobetainyl-CoA:carnitine CoA-transferase CaiB-like acyl-CoA transferase